MASISDSKPMTESEGKKLWIFWVFGLGFFAGFLVSLVVADKIRPGAQKDSSKVATHDGVEAGLDERATGPAEDPIEVEQGIPTPQSHAEAGLEQKEVVLTKAMRNRLLTVDFMTLIQDADIRKYRFEGETKGILLNKIRTGSIFEKIGFKDGDIIEQINGIALADLNQRKAEVAKLPGADRVEFKVRRNEKIERLRVRIADPGQ